MKLNKKDNLIIKDALIEYYHNQIKHTKNEELKTYLKSMIVDFKNITTGAK